MSASRALFLELEKRNAHAHTTFKIQMADSNKVDSGLTNVPVKAARVDLGLRLPSTWRTCTFTS